MIIGSVYCGVMTYYEIEMVLCVLVSVIIGVTLSVKPVEIEMI